MENKIIISAENLRKLTIKAYYNDLNEWRAVRQRDCEIRGRLEVAIHDVIDAMGDVEPRKKEGLLDDQSFFWVTVDELIKRLIKLGLYKD